MADDSVVAFADEVDSGFLTESMRNGSSRKRVEREYVRRYRLT
jgi:hypothetical protein